MRENLDPFEGQATLTEQVAHLQRSDIQNDIKALSKGIAELSVSMARQEEWRVNVGEKIIANATSITTLSKDVAEIKDLASRYKGGLYAILGLGGAITSIAVFWEQIIKFIHR